MKEVSCSDRYLVELQGQGTGYGLEKYGFIAYNDTLSCVQWCQYARKCVGDKMYEHMMEIAAANSNKMR